ncbi:hypothetical protein LF927_08940 [Pectobacterium polaris]|uniref:hypothetical protein n=1 Tax=Pectobacterium polaris TaxID=2042057 RepID=UPI001CF4F7F0|nr:hypothetical protein [Pectobacterium polaris]MCA6941308.1 hypothetical protein [Pectobacterium polaris]MCA6958846.1 hypothetical protein [Pectobacterium polaris]
MPIFRESGGAFTPVKRIDINDAGVIKRVAAGWIADGGVFKKLFPTEPVNMEDSPIFDIEGAINRFEGFDYNPATGRHGAWSLNIRIQILDTSGLGAVTSSLIILTKDGKPQQIQYRLGSVSSIVVRPNGDAPDSISLPHNGTTPLSIMWYSEARWITIPYNAALIGTVLDIRIEVTARGVTYFYDTSATLIAI